MCADSLRSADALVRGHATPFYGGQGRVGVLLCHRFTGSPWAMRGWAEHLVAAGFRVSLPLLPGHGESWQALNETGWPDWYAGVEAEFNVLRRECDYVFVAGMAIGGALALRLAERYGADVTAVVLVNPAVTSRDPRLWLLRLGARFLRSVSTVESDIAKPGVSEYAYRRMPLRSLRSATELWRNVRDNLGRVNQPLLLFQSLNDHVLDGSSAKVIRNGVSSSEFLQRKLPRSFHVATLDYDAEDIYAESVDFILRHSYPALDGPESGVMR